MTEANEPLSPELVLVCPELRAYALERLPARDPDAFLVRAAPAAAGHAGAPLGDGALVLRAAAYALLSFAVLTARGIAVVALATLLLTLAG